MKESTDDHLASPESPAQFLREIEVHYKQTPRTIESSVHEPFHLVSLFPELKTLALEAFVVVYLDIRNGVLGFTRTTGAISECTVQLRPIVQVAVLTNASRVAFLHNHPSGGADPSNADLDLTAEFGKRLGMLGIHLLDHIIIAGDEWLSLAQWQESRNQEAKEVVHEEGPSNTRSQEDANELILRSMRRLFQMGLPMAPDEVTTEVHAVSKSKNKRKEVMNPGGSWFVVVPPRRIKGTRWIEEQRRREDS